MSIKTAYITVYNQLIKLNGLSSSEKVFIENLNKFMETHKIKDHENLSLLLYHIIRETEKKELE